MSWSEHDRTQVHRLEIPAALQKRFDARYRNGLKDIRRWKNKSYPDAKLPTLDDRVKGACAEGLHFDRVSHPASATPDPRQNRCDTCSSS